MQALAATYEGNSYSGQLDWVQFIEPSPAPLYLEEVQMLNYAIMVFAVAAVGGLVLAMHVLRGKFAPWALSLLHAALGATGLVLLAAAFFGEFAGNLTNPVLALFVAGFAFIVIAALGGFILAYKHLDREIPAKLLVIAHASFAVIGFGMLIGVTLALSGT